jgi:hypothetical protein
MATTRESLSEMSPARRAELRRTGIWIVALLLVAACLVFAPRRRARRSTRAALALATESSPLPPACVSFLKEERCWLRSVGNSEDRVELAIGDARAVYERWHESADACRVETQFETTAFEAVGCAHAGDDPRPLPGAARAECPPGTFFFVRQDGHVSGCRPTCTVAEDCDDGSRCSGTGSSAGGPIQEPFCE